MSRPIKEIHRAIRKMFPRLIAVTECRCNHVPVPAAKMRYLFPAKASSWCPVHEQLRVRGQYLQDIGLRVISEVEFLQEQRPASRK